MKKIFTPQQKATLALAAIKGEKTVSQIASAYEVYPAHVQSWKRSCRKTFKRFLPTNVERKENLNPRH